MNIFKKKEEPTQTYNQQGVGDINVVTPPNYGWLEKRLAKEEMDYLWKCIDNQKRGWKEFLAGNINDSRLLIDTGDWFWNNTLLPLCTTYEKEFDNKLSIIPINKHHPYMLYQMWVNYQKQHDFNPIHTHTGVYSFVIWMKIPTHFKQQYRTPASKGANMGCASDFHFTYADTLGKNRQYRYSLEPAAEGYLLFFPAQLPHLVYPFYECEEDRISISGNILLDASKVS